MPKFIIKHGCCYIPPVESESSVTCQVYANPDFNKTSPSDALCRIGQSSPEFGTNHHRKQLAWFHKDSDYIIQEGVELQNPSVHCEHKNERPQNHESFSQQTESEITGVTTNSTSFVTIYGKGKETEQIDSEKVFQHVTVSETSVYRPTTAPVENPEISNKEKILDCISMCLWKCSSWCQ